MLLSNLLLSAPLLLVGDNDYPRRQLLIEPAELAEMEGKLRILDCRTKEQYQKGFIPRAIWIDHNAWSKAFAQHQDPLIWKEIIGGFARTKPNMGVVIYDDAMSKDAARIWGILRYWGFKDVRLLNGGWQGWVKSDLPISNRAVQKPAEVEIELSKPKASSLATRESVLEILKHKKTQIIDTRSAAEHCGDTKLAKRGGAIPGAIHLDWNDLLDKKTKRFKRPDELRDTFKRAGIDLTKPAVAHCQSGGRSSVMAFALELMGARDVANYYRGWSEWGNDENTPVVVKKK
jgi:thiosulfate/3-mercaptopyruvate sulfurtransferase